MRFACKRLLILECLKLTTWLTSLLQRRYYGWLFLLSDFAVAEEIFCFARMLKAGPHRIAPTHFHYFQQTIFFDILNQPCKNKTQMKIINKMCKQ
jgi:hypothetical protein